MQRLLTLLVVPSLFVACADSSTGSAANGSSGAAQTAASSQTGANPPAGTSAGATGLATSSTGMPSEASTTASPADSGTSESGGSTGIEGFVLDGSWITLTAVATVLDPTLPLQFITQTRLVGDGAEVQLIPLSLNVGSRTEPRELLLEHAVTVPVTVDAEGEYVLYLASITIPGEANPITGLDVDIREVQLYPDDLFEAVGCGTMTGRMVAPVELSLDGSTIGVTQLYLTGMAYDPSDVPLEFITSCE